MEITKEKVKGFVKEFKKIFRGYGIEFDDEESYYTRITHPKMKYYVYSERFEEATNFVRCVKLAKEEGIIKRLKSDFVSELGYLFSMLGSKKVYNGINQETILRDEYIQRIKISDDIKLFFAKYVDGCIENIRYGGTDGEGCEYKSCDYTDVKY